MNQYTDKQLAEAYQEGNTEALKELLTRYMPLILSYAKRQHTLTLGREEVIHQLILLFIEAIKAYDTDSSIPLAGYIHSKIHYGHWNLFKKVRRIWQHEILSIFQTIGGHDIGDNQEYQKVSSPSNQDSRLIEASPSDSNYQELAKTQPFSTSSVEEAVINTLCYTDMHKRLMKALSSLTKRDKDLIYAIYFQGKTLAQYARDSQCSRQNITYRHNKILQSLKESLCANQDTRY